MKHVIIAAHPKEDSFTMTMAKAYMDAANREGHEVLLRDLYRMKFDPVLHETELPWAEDFCEDKIVAAEHRLLANAGVYIFLYPFWFNAPPAIMKGYMERVFCMGFAYKSTQSGNEPLLSRRSMISITSSGAPNEWLIKSGGLETTRKLFDEHFAAVCGLKVIDHLHFGGIVPGIRDDVVAGHAAQVQAAFEQHFGRTVSHSVGH